MSRIGKMPIEISDKVEVNLSGNEIKVKGPLGELSYTFSDKVEVKKEDNSVIVTPLNEQANALWGTTRAIINNMIIGVSKGYKKTLEINGVGYKFEVSGNKLILSIGYSHKVEMQVPAGLKAELDEKLKNVLHISGIDKQLVGEFASKVRAKKKPEPYKGKGIKYSDEHIRRKAGKTGGK
ncbi:50S ribosomal protein L6 [Candidatus Gracilibacteria bacterium]|nr:MAG: 50S ribosomal protein L6 [Candidatus Gracilibacteria bacterium]